MDSKSWECLRPEEDMGLVGPGKCFTERGKGCPRRVGCRESCQACYGLAT